MDSLPFKLMFDSLSSRRLYKTISILIVFVFIVTLLSSCGSERVRFVVDWQEGETYELTQTIDQTITQTIGQFEQSIEQKQEITLRQHVKERTDDEIVVEVTYDAMRVNLTANNRSFRYDSESPSENNHPGSEMLNGLVGSSFEMVLTPGGDFKDIRGLGEMLDRVTGQSGAPGANMRKMFNEESMESMLSQMFRIYEDTPRSVGDEWSAKLSLKNPMPMVVNTDYKFEEIDGNQAVVAVSSEISPHPNAESTRMGGAEVTYKPKGKQTGTLRYNIEEKYIQQVKLDQEMSGEMIMKAPGRPEQTIPMNIEGTYKITGEKVN